MELRQLRYFIAVAEQLSFTRAALRLHVSQPPLSRQVCALESELGVRLLERNRHSVALTEAGRVFLLHSRGVVESVEAAAAMARRAAGAQHGSLVLGYGGIAAYTFIPLIPTILRAFHREHPSVKVSLAQLALVEQRNALCSGRVDIGFVLMPFEHKLVSTQPVRRERLVVAVPADHPLAKRSRVRLAELEPHPFVMFHRARGFGYESTLMEICGDAGFRPSVKRKTAPMESVIGLVAAGEGIALVPSTAGRAQMPEVAFVPLQDESACMEFAFAWRTDNESALSRAFLGVARKVVARPASRAGAGERAQ